MTIIIPKELIRPRLMSSVNVQNKLHVTKEDMKLSYNTYQNVIKTEKPVARIISTSVQGPPGPRGPSVDESPSDLTFTYNPDNTLARIDDTTDNTHTLFTYDSNGYLDTITRSTGNTKTLTYDSNGLLSSITNS